MPSSWKIGTPGWCEGKFGGFTNLNEEHLNGRAEVKPHFSGYLSGVFCPLCLDESLKLCL